MKKKEIIIISILLLLQTLIYIICGINKSYIHMDEAYSLGLASYDRTEIQEKEDFYNTWHDNAYYDDYLSVQEEEAGKYSQVYENQKNDVHPPLYYLLLRFAMGFTKGQYSKWSGIIMNILIYLGITILMYAIAKKLLKGQKYVIEKASIIAFLSSITIASLTNVIYIRMYALSTLNILLTTYLHIRLWESKKTKNPLLMGIGISALIGSLTHYYYLFYLAMLYLIFTIQYVKQKEYKTWIYYTITMGIAGILSLIIFPYSIQHMFFGYRGQGVLSKLTDMSQFLMNISAYLGIVHYFVFHNLLLLLIIAMVILSNWKKKKKIEKDLQQHMSEIKRIMKYMQSSQIDAERQLYLDKIKELEEKVKLLESDKETVLEREANAKAGFVYIISNIGSFGEDIYKIGMTRRLEPMDRV